MLLQFKCVIIDDELSAIKLLTNYIDEIPSLDIHKVYTNSLSAVLEIKVEDEIDIILIDINMLKISGVDLASTLFNKVKHILFTTKQSQYVQQASRAHNFDYLLKPISLSTFKDCINGIIQIIRKKHFINHTQQFFIKGDLKGRYLSIKPEDIILIYTQAHYLIIETETSQFKTNETMKNIENRLLTDSRFLRVHQSNIINLEKILSVDGNTIYMVNTWTVPVSEYYKKALINIVHRRLLNTS